MSSTKTHTTTPDGRYQLTHRIKDSWGDFSCNEHHWRLIDTRNGKVLGSWSDESGDYIDGISFRSDHRAVVICFSDGKSEIFPLP